MQLVILGTGEEQYHKILTKLAEEYPKKLALALKFDDALAHLIYAGSDAFLMPSHYEPCGLGQMIAMAYGAVPVVRATGGLADTVKEFKGARSSGNGFTFTAYTAAELERAMLSFLKCYHAKPECLQKVIQNCFNSRFSWESSAKKYLRVYKEIMKKTGSGMKVAA